MYEKRQTYNNCNKENYICIIIANILIAYKQKSRWQISEICMMTAVINILFLERRITNSNFGKSLVLATNSSINLLLWHAE